MKVVVLGLRGMPGIQGGVETHCEELYTRMAGAGHEVHVICRKPYMSYHEPTYRGVRLHPIASPKSRSLEAFAHTFLGVLRARLLSPDVLHIHAIGPSLMVPLARLLGMRTVSTNHGPDYDRQKWGRAAKAILKAGEWLGTRCSTGVIAISRPIADHLRLAYRREAVVIPNGVVVHPPASGISALRSIGLEPGRYVLGVGRLVPEKGFHDLIDAFSKAKLEGWKLAIVGRADHESAYSIALEEQAAKHPSVVMVGFVSGDPLRQLYDHACMFVLPSYHEGLPIVLLEAMSHGLSVLASDIPANRQVGLPDMRFFPPGDVDRAAEQIADFAARSFDAADAERQVAYVRRHFDWDVITDRTIEFYRTLMPSFKPRSAGADERDRRPGSRIEGRPALQAATAGHSETRKVKVLHIIKTLGLGGAETNLLNLARAFDSSRIETHVAYSYGGEIEPRFRAAGVRLVKYSNASHRVKSLHSPLIVLRLAAYIRRHRIDIVQTHNFNGHIWGLLAAKLGGAKVVEHVHDFRYTPTAELTRRHGLLDQYRYIRHFKKMSDRIVVLTRDHASYVVEHGISDASRVVLIPNGITTQRPASVTSGVRDRYGIAADAVVILTGARMDPSKNIDLISRIASAVCALAPNAVFLVAGSGMHLEAYKADAHARGLDARIRFIGFHQDMDELLSIADVFLLPSFLELHSIAILEALRMSVPVVVSRGVGCNDEFIDHGVNGYLCDPFEERPWIDVLGRLALDPALRKRIGLAGHETCERLFSLPNTASSFARLYADLSPAGA